MCLFEIFRNMFSNRLRLLNCVWIGMVCESKDFRRVYMTNFNSRVFGNSRKLKLLETTKEGGEVDWFMNLAEVFDGKNHI